MPILAAKVEQKTVADTIRAIGRVEAFSTVEVKAQINGQVMQVHFRQGQDVKQGDLLFTIDPRPFDAALRQAQANLARDRAQYREAATDAAALRGAAQAECRVAPAIRSGRGDGRRAVGLDGS